MVCGSKPFSASLSRILSPFLGGTRKGPPEGYPAEGSDRAFDKPSPARCAAIAPCGFLQNCPVHRREAIDKALEMGYSKDTKGAASRTAPVCYREVTVTFGRVRRLLLFAILENQSNDS